MFNAARFVGSRLAAGEISLADAWVTCDELADHAVNLRAQLLWAVTDACLAAEFETRKLTGLVRRAVRPLLADGASKGAIEEAAGTAAGGGLPWPDIYAILREEASWITRKPALGLSRGRR